MSFFCGHGPECDIFESDALFNKAIEVRNIFVLIVPNKCQSGTVKNTFLAYLFREKVLLTFGLQDSNFKYC